MIQETTQMTTKIEVSNPTNVKFKIRNLKNEHYPKELLETDYLKLKKGDLVSQGYNYNTIYEVLDIYRGGMSVAEYEIWIKAVGIQSYSPSPSNKQMFDLLEDYKSNCNFGVCYIKIQTALRGNKLPKKGGIKVIKEPADVIGYKTLRKVNLDEQISYKDMNILQFETQIKNIDAKKQTVVKIKDALNTLKKLKNSLIYGVHEIDEVEPEGGVQDGENT